MDTPRQEPGTRNPQPTADWNLSQKPTSALLDMLHDYHEAHTESAAAAAAADPRHAHYATHFYNLRWAVARELERRGFDAVMALGLPKDLHKALRESREPRAVGREEIQLLCKAVALKSGERWITIHPHGEDQPGMPVMVRENPDGTASVVGGAGGALNFVRLTKLKSPEEYRSQQQEKTKAKREEEKQRKATMTPEQKELERSVKARLETTALTKRVETVQRVYQALGLQAPELPKVDELVQSGGVSEAGAKIAVNRELRAHLAYAKLVAEATQEAVMADHDLAAKAGLGDISLGKASDTGLWAGKGPVGIDLLTKEKPADAGGTQPEFKKRAKEQGVSEEAIKEEAKLVRERAHQKLEGEEEGRSHEIGERTQKWNAEAKRLKEEGKVGKDLPSEVKLPEPEKVLDVLRAVKELENVERAVKKERGEIAKKGPELRPFVVDATEDVEPDIVKQFRGEAEVRAARALLGRVEKNEGLTKHIRAGAYDTLNEAALTVGGGELVSRDLVDYLGSAGAARVLAARFRADLEDDGYADVVEAVGKLQGRTSAEIADKAVKEADAELEAAKKIELETVQSPVDIVAARTLNDKRLRHIERAREILGDSYGRVSALGELSLALREAKKGGGEITLDLGDMGKTPAIAAARAFGLVPEVGDVSNEGKEERDIVNKEAIGGSAGGGDYRLESAAGKSVLVLQPSAIGKLSAGVDAKELRQYQQVQAIKGGAKDEEGWLPEGIERRPNSTFNDPTYELGRFDTHFSLGEGSTAAALIEDMHDFVGAHVAEGHDFDDLRTALYSPEFEAARIPEHLRQAFRQHREQLLPLARLTDEEKGLPAKERNQILQKRNDEIRETTLDRARAFSAAYKKKRGMTDDDLLELHTQPLATSTEQTPEAIHRTLAAVPHGAVAFKPLGELQDRDRATLRNYFLQHVAGVRDEPRAASREEKKQSVAPVKQVNIFGEVEELTPEQALGQAPEEEGAKEPSAASKAWGGYVKALGGQQKAYQTLQAMIKGETVQEYARQHARVFGKKLKVGKETLPNADAHLIGRMPEEKLKAALGDKYAEASRLMAIMAQRGPGGKFAAGERKEAAEQLSALIKNTQLGLFEGVQRVSLDRPTIGTDAEKKLSSVWGGVADRFDPKGKQVGLIPDLTMSGDKVKQQRAVRLAAHLRRMGLHFGAGSGKSLISIGTFTHLHAQGKAKKAVFVVPSAVLGQFGSEMLRFTTPGKYNWLADPSARREDRFNAYGDDSTHMVVVTHDSFRDDLMHALAQYRGEDPDQASAWFKGQDAGTQRAALKAATDHLGWKTDTVNVDEAQDILNRAGKPDSTMARAIDGYSYHMRNYLSMTGTPVKNDESEAFDVLRKIDPDRFHDRDEFMRKYGGKAPASKASLQRLMARYVYTDRIPSGVNRFTDVRTLALTPKQQAAYQEVEQALAKVRTSRRSGKLDVEAVKTLAPEKFEGKPESEHAAIAAEVAKKGLGGRVEHARARVVNGYDYEHNAKVAALKEDLNRDREKPHVVFAHNYYAIGHIERACKETGLKVGVLTGKQTAAEKAKIREAFQGGELDVMVNSDAGSTGQNLQRGTVLINYDTPDTAMCHEQRNARIDRIGQQNDVTVRDYTTDTPYERRVRRRLEKKQGLADVFQSPTENLDDTGLAAEIQSVRAARRNSRQAA